MGTDDQRPTTNDQRPTSERRVAVVTGAGRGIGRATVLALAARGFAVALAARTEAELAAVAAEVEAAGGQALVVPTDVGDAGQVDAMAARTLEAFGRIDVLVNNAGVGVFQPVDSYSLDAWERQLRINLTGTFLACRAVLPSMLARGSGHIVNVLSIAAKTAFPSGAAYCASKWGALGFTRVLAKEVRARGIKVTAFCPGAVDTAIWDETPGAPDRARMMRPEDVAEAIAWVVTQPPGITTDEILVMPPEGIL
jgi:NADP-dependent 3-hydroxy acid dehydrogenase YdfG